MIEYKKVIGFCGRKRSGKTTLAETVKNETGGEIVTIANYLKRLCCKILGCTLSELNNKKDNGTVFSLYPTEYWFEVINECTGISIDEIKKDISETEFTSVRQMLQVIGTDCIRKHSPQWHIFQMKKEINNLLSKGKTVVVDDVRFPNEKKAIEEYDNSETYFIIRPLNTDISNHISETSLKWQLFDANHIIVNDCDFGFLKKDFLCHNRLSRNTVILSEKSDKYVGNPHFGEKETQFVKDILEFNRYQTSFRKQGVIHFELSSKKKINNFIKQVWDGNKDIVLRGFKKGEIVPIYNPLINENLKIYLN